MNGRSSLFLSYTLHFSPSFPCENSTVYMQGPVFRSEKQDRIRSRITLILLGRIDSQLFHVYELLGEIPSNIIAVRAVCFEPLLSGELDCGNSMRMFYSETTGIGCGKQRGFPRESGPSCWPLAVYISSAAVVPGRDWPAHPL